MPKAEDGFWELAGYLMWLIGSALFAIVSYRNDDALSLVGSLLFFIGIIAVMVPMVASYRRRQDHEETHRRT